MQKSVMFAADDPAKKIVTSQQCSVEAKVDETAQLRTPVQTDAAENLLKTGEGAKLAPCKQQAEDETSDKTLVVAIDPQCPSRHIYVVDGPTIQRPCCKYAAKRLEF